MATPRCFHFLLLCSAVTVCSSLRAAVVSSSLRADAVSSSLQTTRRQGTRFGRKALLQGATAAAAGALGAALCPTVAVYAALPDVSGYDASGSDISATTLTEEEKAARALRRQSKAASPDYNPDAGLDLRSKGRDENLRSSLAKQSEMKKRDKKVKGQDMCEMLGRGC
ncbi:hypothetical protein T492DRAFT_919700 [Pavlovales sp. CCMP2436]|nr:hypothetical protein T492DRAFT_919700 [Pavlovales sp. CCMP2436]